MIAVNYYESNEFFFNFGTQSAEEKKSWKKFILNFINCKIYKT